MKVLIINKFLNRVGGAESYAIDLGDMLKSQGHDVQYFGMNHEDKVMTNDYDIYVDKVDFRNNNLMTKLKYSLKTIYSIEAKTKLRLLLKEFQPDICHLNNINFQLTPSIIYELKKWNIPIVQTVHDVQLSCPAHRYYIEHTNQICKSCVGKKFFNCVKNNCVHNSKLKSTIAATESYLYHGLNTYRLIDKFIAPSHFMRNELVGVGVDSAKIAVVHNFFKPSGQVPVETAQQKYALYFGRLSHEKGILTLIEACERTPEVLYKIVGDGLLKDEVTNKIASMTNVEYLGFKSGQELHRLIQNAAFSIYPSECYENCPLSIIESISLSTPVIASDLGGSPELVNNGKTGLVFTASSVSELVTSITELWTDDALLEGMTENCKKEPIMTTDSYYALLEKCYRELVRD